MSNKVTNSRETSEDSLMKCESLERLENYPIETVCLVTEEYGYPQGTGVQELRDELASLRIDLGLVRSEPEGVSERLRWLEMQEELAYLPRMYAEMIQRCEWYLEVVPIDVGAKELGLSTLELLKLIEEDERNGNQY